MIFEVLSGGAAREVDPDHVPWPEDSLVVYARKDGGDIIGRCVLLQMPHVEAVWVREDHRGSTLGSRLVEQAEEILRQHGRTHAWAYVAEDEQPEVGGYLKRLGYKTLPLTLYTKELSCHS